MSKFVNFNKRGFLLPSGVKDLIGMIQQDSAIPEFQQPCQTSGMTICHDETLLTPLRELRGPITEFLRPGPEFRMLEMRCPECPVRLQFHRQAPNHLSGSVIFPDEPQLEEAMRGVFARLRLLAPPPASFVPTPMFPGVQIQTIFQIEPMPSDGDNLMTIVQQALTCGCDLKAETPIECLRIEGEYPPNKSIE